ncbi:MAG TPA: hypothetical protein VK983_01825 [Candidatus Limnocylindrales bacterium]|nr:hypothetical protein [Candidatus Limnocylindrales bacterium]
MHTLVEILAKDYPQLTFVAGTSFYWCPETSEVFYDAFKEYQDASAWSLLHETSHALLGHTCYKADLELLKLEVGAWEHAQQMAPKYAIKIDQDYVQDCLDTYRDWLYRRSLCPGCGTQCIQLDASSYYRCFNCHTRWHVSPSRFCRPYRRAQAKTREYSTAFALKMIGH